MKKLLLISFLALFASSQVQAGFISNITGADLAGIEITATFDDGADFFQTETLTWAALTSDSGGVTGSDWSLSLSGETFGAGDGEGGLVGAWILNVTNPLFTTLFIDLSTLFVFDILEGDASGNGSGDGRPFFAFNEDSQATIGHEFGGFVQDELYSTLEVTNLGLGDTLFVIDTDAVDASARPVSAPATLSIIMLSLFGLMMNARRKQA